MLTRQAADRRALLIGIDHYQNVPRLHAAVNDAKRLAPLFERNDDGSPNYSVKLHTSDTCEITRPVLRRLWMDLFQDFHGDALFYFSGHGAQTPWGGFLVTQEGTREEPGLAMEDLLLVANGMPARSVVLILDCCHAGDLGNVPILQGMLKSLALLRDGVTVLAASRPSESAFEARGTGLFSDALVEGLMGGAADHTGFVDTSSLFIYAERLFGGWDQRPVYKSHTSVVSPLRLCNPAIAPQILRAIPRYFSKPDQTLGLDPEYEAELEPGERDTPRAKKIADMKIFRRLRDARLLETVDGDDLYPTAHASGTIRLTHLGRYYWRLMQQGQL